MMRQQTAVAGSTHALAYADMKARLDEPDIARAHGDDSTYRVGYKAAEAAFVSVKAIDADILVVMLVGKGEASAATIKDGALTVAGKTISLDAAAGKIVCK